MAEEINRTDWQTFKRLMRQASDYKFTFALALVLGICLALVSPVKPFLIQRIIDNEILKNDIEGLTKMSIILIVLLVVEAVFRYSFMYATSYLGQVVIKDLRIKVFDQVQSLNLKFFDRTPIGTATTRTINDVEAINNTFSQGIITIITDILTLITVISFMLYINWKIALVCLSTFPMLIFATYIFKEKVRSAFFIVRDKVSEMNAFLQEHITGMRIVQIFNAEKREFDKFDKINAAHRNANLKSVLYYSIFFPVVEIILALAISLMIWYGSNQVIQGFATIGIFTSFLLYLNMAFRPLRMLADKFNTLQMGIVASERVFKLLDRDDKISNYGSLKVNDLEGNISFRNVWFAYEDDNYVLKNVSFDIKKGETLALVGATGSGKSSIINTLNRFYEINKGAIYVDEVNIKDYDLLSFRSKIAVVLQDVFLFSGSVIDNLTLGEQSISREKIEEAVNFIGGDEFIKRLPGGYDYEVMERGQTLSVGQRQLIAFVRALLFNPDILVLDEATSSVDTESERLIQNAIEKLIKGRTSIVIAHRLSTIQKADKIIVLENGEIKEMGSHAELMKIENGHYKELHDKQFANFN